MEQLVRRDITSTNGHRTPFSGHVQSNMTGELKKQNLRNDFDVFSLEENNHAMQNMKTALHGFGVRKLHS
jgi:hypothetical protein